jgi:hypothetical protein
MNTITNHKLYPSIIKLAAATGLLLLIPLIAMQFTGEVNWTLSDFIIAGIFLFGTGLTYKLITRNSAKMAYRVAIGFALFTGLLLLWVNGAVGIIGSENNPINLLYFGVIAVGIIGALIARFQPQGMAYTMLSMAFAQGLVAATALIGGFYQTPPSSVFEIIGVNGFFIFLFIVSALLFRYIIQDDV